MARTWEGGALLHPYSAIDSQNEDLLPQVRSDYNYSNMQIHNHCRRCHINLMGQMLFMYELFCHDQQVHLHA